MTIEEAMTAIQNQAKESGLCAAYFSSLGYIRLRTGSYCDNNSKTEDMTLEEFTQWCEDQL